MSSAEDEAIARLAINALIEDANVNFKGERKEAFVWGVYNALRVTAPVQLQKLKDLLEQHGIAVKADNVVKTRWLN